MTTPAVIYQPHTRYYIDKLSARLLHDNSGFYSRNDKYREISRDEYDRIRELQSNYAARLTKYQGVHAGRTIHVFGNGPSLLNYAAGLDWSPKLTIGVNAAGREIQPLKYWISVDNLWDVRYERRDLYEWVGPWLKSTKGKTVQFIRRDATLLIHRTERVRARGEALTWEPDEMFIGSGESPAASIAGGLYWTLQSTQAAMDLARHMGASVIVLWGVDLNDRSHSYTGSAEIPGDALDQPGKPWKNYERIVQGYEALKKAFNGLIVNANPGSKLDVFQRVRPDEAIEL